MFRLRALVALSLTIVAGSIATAFAVGAGHGRIATFVYRAGGISGGPNSSFFTSTCFTTTKFKHDDDGNSGSLSRGYNEFGNFRTASGFTVQWSGLSSSNGQTSGTGHGTWSASHLPRECRTSGGSASGRYTSTWKPTSGGYAETVVFSSFPV
jgi:hypothetical protein